MVLDDNTLLQTDATVIAGVLILLTIYSLKPRKSPESRRERALNFIVAGVLLTVIIPFSVSAMMIIYPDVEPAAGATLGGFLYLMVGIVLIVVFSKIHIPERTETEKE
ncbi:MAG: hypothetical protein M3044_11080 [Thermoproteota archaeon]|nr:hypothetical protein [Thermoproteota archaeon]